MKFIIFNNFLPLIVLEVVQMTSGSASDESFFNMTTFLF